jgi:Secretion system C-terminal sorting domain
MNKFITVLLIAMVVAPAVRCATPDTVTVPNDFALGTINNVIQGDTTASGDRVNPLRVYKLLRGGYYLLNGNITIKPGTHIWIVGEPAPATGTDPGMAVVIEGDVTGLYYNFTIDSYGDLTMKNVWMIYATQLGTQNWTVLQFEQDITKPTSRGEFENCIFDYVNGMAVTSNDTGFTGIFKGCIFRNSIDIGQWWAGRMFATVNLSARVDTIWSENCTYENQGFSFQTDYTPPKFVFFNHNTFLNIAKFAFKFYWMTHLICVNNVFVNCHFTGERYQDRIGQDPDNLLWGTVLDVDTMDVSNGLPGTLYNGVAEKDRLVYFYNNSNYTEPVFQTFFDQYNDTVATLKGKILSEPIMNERTLDMFTWHKFMKLDPNYQALDGQNPQFTTSATNTDSILAFLKDRYAIGGTVFWGYNPDLNGTWPLKENLTYTNSTLLTAATGGFPLGDLYHWFPAKYTTWSAQSTTEDNSIINQSVAEVKQVSNLVPQSFTLEQNYPNPFNPTTRISYSIAKRGLVSLKVFNVVGQEVETLFSGLQDAGHYEASFDAKTLASGFYLYRLEAGKTTITKKMMLLK